MSGQIYHERYKREGHVFEDCRKKASRHRLARCHRARPAPLRSAAGVSGDPGCAINVNVNVNRPNDEKAFHRAWIRHWVLNMSASAGSMTGNGRPFGVHGAPDSTPPDAQGAEVVQNQKYSDSFGDFDSTRRFPFPKMPPWPPCMTAACYQQHQHATFPQRFTAPHRPTAPASYKEHGSRHPCEAQLHPQTSS